MVYSPQIVSLKAFNNKYSKLMLQAVNPSASILALPSLSSLLCLNKYGGALCLVCSALVMNYNCNK